MPTEATVTFLLATSLLGSFAAGYLAGQAAGRLWGWWKAKRDRLRESGRP